MLTLSSIACKNNSTNNDTPPPEVKKYASLSLTSDSVTNLILKQDDAAYSSEITIKFTDATSTTLSSAADENGTAQTIASGELIESYANGKVNFNLEKLKNTIGSADLNSPKTYKLTFAVAGENTNANITVDIRLFKTKKLTGNTEIKALFKRTTAIKNVDSDSTHNDRHSFTFSSGTFTDTKATFTDEIAGDYNMNISVVKDAVQKEIDDNFGTYFSSATIGNTETATSDKSTLIVPLNLTTKPEYEFDATTYNLEFILYKQNTDKFADSDSNGWK